MMTEDNRTVCETIAKDLQELIEDAIFGILQEQPQIRR